MIIFYSISITCMSNETVGAEGRQPDSDLVSVRVGEGRRGATLAVTPRIVWG